MLHTVLQIDPQHFRANLLLGRILTLQGHPEEAVFYLKQATSSEPDNFEPHAFLADAYDQLGDAQAATAERNRSESLKRTSKQ